MKKLTLVIGALFLFAALVNAQNSALRTSVKSVQGKSLHVPNVGSVLTTICDTVLPAAISGTCMDSLTVYYLNNADTGYIAGQNIFGFSASAEKFAAIPGGSISGVIVWWALKIGTTGTTSAAIYTVDANGGPGTQIGSGSTTIDKSAIDTLGFGAGFHNMYSFATPPSVGTSPFFVVVSYPATFTFGSDELGMAVLKESCSNISADSTGWLDCSKFGGWLSYKHAFSGANFDMAIFPVVCTPTGVNNVNSLDNNIVVYPNPVNNQFTVQFIGNEQKDVVISVYNAIGQLVKNVSANNSIDHAVIDMSDVAKGIYIVNIKTSEGNAVKRVSVIR